MVPQSTALDADVIVVGFGPVGATLALLMARRGRRVSIIERQPTLYGLPRAVHIDHGQRSEKQRWLAVIKHDSPADDRSRHGRASCCVTPDHGAPPRNRYDRRAGFFRCHGDELRHHWDHSPPFGNVCRWLRRRKHYELSWLESIVHVVEIGSDVIFGDETVTGWFAEHDVAVALVRPDSMVFGAVHDAVQVAQLSRTLRAYFNQGPHS